jgi:hypothetical protein
VKGTKVGTRKTPNPRINQARRISQRACGPCPCLSQLWEARGVLQQVLHLNADLVRESGMLAVERFHDSA